MTTVIDALIVTLGLNAQGFLQGNREANQSLDRTRTNTRTLTQEEEKREKANAKNRKERNKDYPEQRRQQKESIDNFRELTRQAVSFFGITTTIGGMGAWIGGITQANSQLYRTSLNLDTSVESLKAWGMAIEQTGGDAKSAVGTMQNLSDMMTGITLGVLPSNLNVFNLLGVDLFKASKSAEPLVEVLKMINKGAQKLKETRGQKEAFNIVRMLGIDSDMANLLVQDEKSLNDLLDSVKKINVLNEAAAKKSYELARQWVILKQKGDALGQTIENQVSPSIIKLLENLMKFSEENPKIVAGIGIIAGALLSRFAPVKALLVGIGALLGISSWQEWANGGKSFIGSLIEDLNKLYVSAKRAFYASRGAFTPEPQQKIDSNFSQWGKAVLKNINHIVFLGDNTSKTQKGQGDLGTKKTGKNENTVGDDYRFTPSDFKKNLIKKGYTSEEAQEQIDFYIKEVGLDNRGRINSQLNIDKKKQSSALKLQNNAEKLAAQPSNINNQTTSTSTNSTKIGQVVIYTQATDAKGIANELPRALVNQAESGGF